MRRRCKETVGVMVILVRPDGRIVKIASVKWYWIVDEEFMLQVERWR